MWGHISLSGYTKNWVSIRQRNCGGRHTSRRFASCQDLVRAAKLDSRKRLKAAWAQGESAAKRCCLSCKSLLGIRAPVILSAAKDLRADRIACQYHRSFCAQDDRGAYSQSFLRVHKQLGTLLTPCT